MATRICDAVKGSDDLLLVDLIRVIRSAIPIERGFALLVSFAGDIFQELVIAGDAAAILRWASPFSAEELRIELSGFGSLKFFDNDPDDQRASNALIKPIQKLRWMGMDDEVERVQKTLAACVRPTDSVIAPADTD